MNLKNYGNSLEWRLFKNMKKILSLLIAMFLTASSLLITCFIFLDKELFLKSDILYKITEGSLYWMLGLGVVNSIMISMEYWRNVFEKGDKNE